MVVDINLCRLNGTGSNTTRQWQLSDCADVHIHRGIMTFLCFVGVVIALCNLCILLIVGRNKDLRKKKEFLIPTGLGIFDFLYGVFYIAGPLRHLYVFSWVRFWETTTLWNCFLRAPESLLFFFGGQGMSMMLAWISVDRLIAMFSLKVYLKLGVSFAYKVIGFTMAYCSLSMGIGMVMSYQETRFRSHKICYAIFAVPLSYRQYHFVHLATFGLLSSVVYVLAMLFMHRRAKDVEHDSIKALYKKRQVKVTRMLLYVVGMTFVLFTVPMTMMAIDYSILGDYTTILVFISTLNSANNVFIYIAKNGEMRAGFLALFRLQKNPTKNSVWAVKSTNLKHISH